MRIAIDARYLSAEYSGIGNYSENLLRRLVPADPENRYSIFVHDSFNRDLPLPDNAELIPCHARPVSVHTLTGFGAAVRATGADILHSFFPITPLFCRLPTIVTVHDLQALLAPGFTGRRPWPVQRGYDLFYRWVYPRSLRSARWLIAVSHATKRDMARIVPETRSNTLVIYEGVDPSYGEPIDETTVQEVAKRYDLPERFVLYIGSTRPNKNLPNMIRAFDRMRERYDDIRDVYFVLVVNADRFFDESRRLIKRLKLQKRMRVFQQVGEIEKRSFYARASALYFVTKNEGFGLPLLEAQASGLPALVADHASLPEIAAGSALLADPDSPGDIARRLRRVLTDSATRSNLVAAGRENVKRFDWNRAASQVRDMYHYLF